MERAIGDGVGLAELRRRVAAIEGRPESAAHVASSPSGAAAEGSAIGLYREADAVSAGLDFGLADIDRRLGPLGGLAAGNLHEFVCDESRAAGTLTGFVAALLARLVVRRSGRVLWIATREARRETGALHAPGLAAFGFPPDRLVEAIVGDPQEALWAAEEGLSCRGSAAVVVEIPGSPRILDLTTTRRLALRAGDGGTLGLLVRAPGTAQTTAAATRWRVAERGSRPFPDFSAGLGRPAFRLTLEKNRDGRLGDFELEWNPHDRSFALLAAHSGARPRPLSDRPSVLPTPARIFDFPVPAGGDRI
jgi:protein ImuA